jgi:hypothetical protein
MKERMPSPSPWNEAESEMLLTRIFRDRNTKPISGRTKEQCERHLHAIVTASDLNQDRVLAVWQANNPGASTEKIKTILSKPVEGQDEERYYEALCQTIALHKDLESGIRAMVVSYYNRREVIRAAMPSTDHMNDDLWQYIG